MCSRQFVSTGLCSNFSFNLFLSKMVQLQWCHFLPRMHFASIYWAPTYSFLNTKLNLLKWNTMPFQVCIWNTMYLPV